MSKGFYLILSGIYFIMFCFNLIGSNTNTISRSEESSLLSETAFRYTTKTEKTKDDLSIRSDEADLLNFDQCVKKIWVVEEWDGSSYDYSFSFFITEIEDNNIKGKFRSGTVAYPDFCQYGYTSWLGDLTGRINDGIIDCQLNDGRGGKGTAKLLLLEFDMIEATIEFTSRSGYGKCKIVQGTHLFRPHNFTDIENGIGKLEAKSFGIDLDSWGNVNFVTVLFDTGRVWYPGAYLTDEYGNVLYKFDSFFQTATRIIDVKIDDIDRDGLKDIRITTGFIDYKTGDVLFDMPQIEKVFFQMSNGIFYE